MGEAHEVLGLEVSSHPCQDGSEATSIRSFEVELRGLGLWKPVRAARDLASAASAEPLPTALPDSHPGFLLPTLKPTPLRPLTAAIALIFDIQPFFPLSLSLFSAH